MSQNASYSHMQLQSPLGDGFYHLPRFRYLSDSFHASTLARLCEDFDRLTPFLAKKTLVQKPYTPVPHQYKASTKAGVYPQA
jgi:hypothetical protein